jgi:hypothetical protein
MTIRALVPFSFVFTAVYGEIILIMPRVIYRDPSRVCAVTHRTVGRKITRLVIGTGGSPEIGFVTGETVGRRIGKTTPGVASGTVIDLMPLGQREKQVTGTTRRPEPAIAGHVVTHHAIGRKPGCCVVRHRCRHVVVEMAIDAFISNSVKSQNIVSMMAVDAISGKMLPQQRKSIASM